MQLTRARVLRVADVGPVAPGVPTAPRRGAVVEARVAAAHVEAERVLAAARDAASALERAALARADAAVAAAAAAARDVEVARLAAIALHLEARQAGLGAREIERSVELAKLLAERLVGAQLSLEPRRIADILAELLAAARGASSARVLGCPDDLEALRQALGALGLPPDAVALVEDETLTRGSLVLESDLGTVDGRLEARLDRLAEALMSEVRAQAQARVGEPR
ncbi:MAG: hypothetical protein IPF92_26805 [Myxococcales bacterium]|nr:hypothetical protein [Myxococcales bacterium]MBL0194127.1 hypothetical protein [Myxococcales bacterium]HQY64300.1 FliH/SctL family protein [Polyangiaceae bacterium]